MAPFERPIPPVGEEIHLPGGSLQPLLLTVGITLALVGVTLGTSILIAGVVLSVVTLVKWIADARHEFAELPADHHVHSHDTAPIERPGPTRTT